MDKTIKKAQQQWKIEAKEKHYRLSELLSPVYKFFIHQPISSGVIDEQWMKRLATNYIIPAFIKEYEFLKQNPNSDTALLLSQSRNNFLFSHKYELPEPLWRRLYDVYENMPKTISAYLDKVEFSDYTTTKAKLQALRWELPGQQALWEIEECIYKDNFDLAFEKILAHLSINTGIEVWTLKLGRRLALHYAKKGDRKSAFRVLDEITGLASEDVFAARKKSFKECYTKIDRQDGEEHFEEIIMQRSGMANERSPVNRMKLSGSFKDATSGEFIDIQSFSGNYIFLDFWTTWCSPCRTEIPELKRFAERHKNCDDFAIVSIVGDLITGGAGKNGVAEFVREFDINYTSLIDDPKNSLTKYFAVKRWPSKFLLDKKFQIVFSPKDMPTLEMIGEYLEKHH